MAHAPLSLHEREEIGAALIADREASWASIARRIARHRGTVAREVIGRGGRHGYCPAVAQQRAEAAPAAAAPSAACSAWRGA